MNGVTSVVRDTIGSLGASSGGPVVSLERLKTPELALAASEPARSAGESLVCGRKLASGVALAPPDAGSREPRLPPAAAPAAAGLLAAESPPPAGRVVFMVAIMVVELP